MANEGLVALDKNIVVLLGGVGGAKLAAGLAQILPARRLTFVVNTGDDFWHLGLKICPDLDTVMYTLARMVNPDWGWGLQGDSVVTLEALHRFYGVDTWFRLGDKDLATHILRSQLLRCGRSLTETTRRLSESLGLEAALLPMSAQEIPTMIETVEYGELAFQEYFVKHRWRPVLKSIRHAGCERSSLSFQVRSALSGADIVLIAPSNPWLSLAPILAVNGMRDLLASLDVPIVAVTPVIRGAAVKGPTAKIMSELGQEVTAANIADFYTGIINGFVNDIQNEPLGRGDLRSIQVNTLMKTEADKRSLAVATLNWIESWGA